jgi:hypothetical protein
MTPRKSRLAISERTLVREAATEAARQGILEALRQSEERPEAATNETCHLCGIVRLSLLVLTLAAMGGLGSLMGWN